MDHSICPPPLAVVLLKGWRQALPLCASGLKNLVFLCWSGCMWLLLSPTLPPERQATLCLPPCFCQSLRHILQTGMLHRPSLPGPWHWPKWFHLFIQQRFKIGLFTHSSRYSDFFQFYPWILYMPSVCFSGLRGFLPDITSDRILSMRSLSTMLCCYERWIFQPHPSTRSIGMVEYGNNTESNWLSIIMGYNGHFVWEEQGWEMRILKSPKMAFGDAHQ